MKKIIIFIVLVLFIFYPRIKINNQNMDLKVFNNYIEPGFKAYNLLFDFSDKVKINSNLNNKKIGTYKIEYSYKFLFLEFKRVRIVNVVDREKPIIKIDNKEKICKNSNLNSLILSANDNYDGDLKNKVVSYLKKDKLVYELVDSSKNKKIITKKISFLEEKPTIKLNGNNIVYLSKDTNYTESGYTAYDICDGNITNKVDIKGTVNTSRPGTYIIKYSVKNSSNKMADITRKIVVLENKVDNYSKNGKIYLTFDDGPSKSITPKLLEILKEENVKATFFVTGKSDSLNYLIKKEYDSGHTVALHTYSHDYKKIYISSDAYFKDLYAIKSKVKNITGYDSNIIRFPGGSSNTVSKKYKKGIMTYLTLEVKKRGFIYFDWNISSGDAGGAKNSNEVYHNVTSKLSKNKTNIVLMHDYENNYKTLNAIRDIIKFGKKNGYTFDVISDNTPYIRHQVNN